MKELTHTDKKGKAVMVNVGTGGTDQDYWGSGHIVLAADTLKLIRESDEKGDVPLWLAGRYNCCSRPQV
jgi:molybdenum cofactor biosynthesis enzyme